VSSDGENPSWAGLSVRVDQTNNPKSLDVPSEVTPHFRAAELKGSC